MMRKISVYSTTDQQHVEIMSDATKWGELKESIKDMFNLEVLSAMENKTRNNLEHDEAILPEGEFVLYLYPSKRVKLGCGCENEKEIEMLKNMSDEELENLNKNMPRELKKSVVLLMKKGLLLTELVDDLLSDIKTVSVELLKIYKENKQEHTEQKSTEDKILEALRKEAEDLGL